MLRARLESSILLHFVLPRYTSHCVSNQLHANEYVSRWWSRGWWGRATGFAAVGLRKPLFRELRALRVEVLLTSWQWTPHWQLKESSRSAIGTMGGVLPVQYQREDFEAPWRDRRVGVGHQYDAESRQQAKVLLRKLSGRVASRTMLWRMVVLLVLFDVRDVDSH